MGLDPLIASWFATVRGRVPARSNANAPRAQLPRTFTREHVLKLRAMIDFFVQPCLDILRRHLAEPVPTADNNLLRSLMRLLDTVFEEYRVKEGRDPPTDEAIALLLANMEATFMFALTWSVGATVNSVGRARMDAFIRQEMAMFGCKAMFPPQGQIYDFKFDAEGRRWVPWMETVEPYKFDSKLSYEVRGGGGGGGGGGAPQAALMGASFRARARAGRSSSFPRKIQCGTSTWRRSCC